MKINLTNPQTRLDKAAWWAFFLSVGWAMWLLIYLMLVVAIVHDEWWIPAMQKYREKK